MEVVEGKTGEFKYALPAEGGHTKGIYGVGWESDSQHIYTASADDTIKVGVVRECERSIGISSAESGKRPLPSVTASRCHSISWAVLLS